MSEYPNSSQRLLALRQAQQALSMGRTSLYAKLNSGEISAVKVGRRTYIKQEEINRFVQGLKPYATKPVSQKS